MTDDPFDQLRQPARAMRPRDRFADELRSRLDTELTARELRRLPTAPTGRADAAGRAPTATSTATPTTSTTTTGATMPAERSPAATAYLAVHDGAAALAFYAAALGAEELTRMEHEGKVVHAEFDVAGQRYFLSDAFPEIGAHAPTELGGSTVALVLNFDDPAEVDRVFTSAVAEGASGERPPADQDHGHRIAWIRDPYGHRWSLGAPVEAARPDLRAVNGGIWPAINAVDAPAMATFMTDVLGFVEQIRVLDDRDPDVFVHSQFLWPEGGTVQVGTANRAGNPYAQRASGNESVYVVTDQVRAVYDRCVAAGVEVLRSPEEPDHDPGGLSMACRDHEGNIWSFGTYGGE